MTRPNIVIIYMDDLGYGDVGAYGASAVDTPHIDRLAARGLRFTDGYATSATCTPSRYALLTGEYPWRKSGAEILTGDAAMIIEEDQMTLPSMLAACGYRTGIVGKWHLGLGDGGVNWNRPIRPCPLDVGFGESYIIAATQDRVPTVYIEDRSVVGLDPEDPIEVSYEHPFPGEPVAAEHPEMLRLASSHGHDNAIVNGIGRIGYMRGGQSARWTDEDMAERLVERAKDFVRRSQESGEDRKPFFLYLALHQPHVPRTPSARFVGATDMGPRGDAIAEADWCVGEILDELEAAGVLDDTLIVFSSDNGPVLDDGYQDDAVERVGDHRPTGPLRGGKYSLFDAGTRVPFIVHWPARVTPGTSSALVCQMDLLASIAALVGADVPTADSENHLAALLGETEIGRESLVVEAVHRTAFRRGEWAMIPPHTGPERLPAKDIETGNADRHRLYNLREDPHQDHDLASAHPDTLRCLVDEFARIREVPT
ncbi:arylsulfatase [Microbacterium sp. H37-C3]|uniref:sulfatase family protein n=1 Tax=Microbacterium sp. H37-C3 TaxID=3004354 RepID=UPI0022AEF511|nr:arylsulfatase [Microbacterium sp. H37-C3]MCZ4069000.1 arylsulfatase [Microbacterium sp. H37-C3]